MLRLLLGRAGSGKTETCLREALAALAAGGPDGPPLVLLAPEQATYQLERALLQRLPAGAALVRLEVLSFGRLARRILTEVGGLTRSRLDEAGRRMLLRELLRRHRDALRTFGGSADRPGLALALAAQLAEFEAYAVDADELRLRAESAEPGMAERLTDLALLWEAYQGELAGRLAGPGSELAAAAAALPASTFAGARLWVDGFAGFTPREERLLGASLRAGGEVCAALCLDGREWLAAPRLAQDDPAHPFAPTRRTLRRLLRDWPAAAVEVQEAPTTGGRFRSGALARLERHLWDEPPPAGPVPAAPPAVWAAAFPDPQAEAEAAAAEIDRLCRQEGYRYREIAVIIRDQDTYQPHVAAACAARQLPVFLDRRRPADNHPVFGVLRSALAVLAEHWSGAAVRRHLHQDLCGLDRSDADLLENFAVAHGLGPAQWGYRGVLRFPPPQTADDRESPRQAARRRRHENRLHRLRLRLSAPLWTLEHAWGGAAPARQAAAACRGLLASLRAAECTQDWAAAAHTAGRPEEAQWHRLCGEQPERLLQQLELALGDRPITPVDLLGLLQAGIQDLTVGLVPPRLDQVLCGAVHRSRHPEIRAAFVLGMGAGVFPPPAAESPLLADADRVALQRLGTELAPTAEQRLLDERYLGYIALTRAAERLYLSHSEGTGPSELFRQATAAVCVAPWAMPAGPEVRAGVDRLATALALRLRVAREARLSLPPPWAGALEWLDAAPERRGLVAAAHSGLARRAPPPLGQELASRLYPTAQSATRLEAAAACAFQHFARYGLGLGPRAEPGVDQSHLGRLLHAALAHFVRGLLADGREPAEVTAEEARQRSEAALRSAAPLVLGQLPAGSPRGPLLLRSAGRDLHRAVEALLLQARAGAYRPEAVELDFASDGVRGRIDRLDAARGRDGALRLRVVDYKTGTDRFSLSAFCLSLDLQTVLYLHAALQTRPGAIAGGLFLLHVRDEIASAPGPQAESPPPPQLRGLAPAEADELDLHGPVVGVRLKKDGTPVKNAPVADPKQFALLRRALERRVRALRDSGAGGEVAPNPYRLNGVAACASCQLQAVCGFDPGAGDRFRALRSPENPWMALAAEEARTDA